MRDFLTALQFLTRIHVATPPDLTEADFGHSVKFFPLVGAVIGAVYGGAAFLIFIVLLRGGVEIPPGVGAALLVALTVVVTGGIFYDGFMDTIDGIFSGRSREKMLEIMKDSTVGANAVMGFVILILLDFNLILALPSELLWKTLFIMPIISRTAVVMAITEFPYARPQGMGKAFADYAEKKSLPLATIISLICVCPMGLAAVTSLVVGMGAAFVLLRYAAKILGGVTGDVYGWVATLTETTVMVSMMIAGCFDKAYL